MKCPAEQESECDDAAVVAKAADRKLYLFTKFPDVSRGDLIQEGLAAILTARGYDSRRSRSTWVYTVAQRRMIDVWRKRKLRADVDFAYFESRAGDVIEVIDPVEQAEVFEGKIVGTSDGQSLADWCATMRRNARIAYRHHLLHIGPRCYKVSRLSPLVLLMRRLDLGATALRWVLERRPDLLLALGFKHVPGRRMFDDAAKLAKKAERIVKRRRPATGRTSRRGSGRTARR